MFINEEPNLKKKTLLSHKKKNENLCLVFVSLRKMDQSKVDKIPDEAIAKAPRLAYQKYLDKFELFIATYLRRWVTPTGSDCLGEVSPNMPEQSRFKLRNLHVICPEVSIYPSFLRKVMVGTPFYFISDVILTQFGDFTLNV